MTDYVKHPAEDRGAFTNDWLDSRHTFNFGQYRRPDRTGFSDLLVINDDWVEPSKGFATHPHNNMEIISIPLVGTLKHEDSEGNKHIIEASEVQLMSAGSGITHSEYNHSDTDKVNFLQIWIQPNVTNTEPGYQQKAFMPEDYQNKIKWVVAPAGKDTDALVIKQDAMMGLLNLEAGKEHSVQIEADYDAYVFVIEGAITLDDACELAKRDGVGISDIEGQVAISAKENSSVLLMKLRKQ